MPHKVVQFPQAIADQDDIWFSIALDNETAANGVIDRFSEMIDLLSRHPEAGRARDDIRPGLRHCPVGSYTIFYTYRDGTVEIRRIMHGARRTSSEHFDD